ncbi:single-stranded DNA-binding protein [Latilactobacillus curvatus]|uniref:single-stranded DNA-binding protein n=1 Tax=Latilactobacillus curvatus TaxID=28038 RepID=UPI0020A3B3B1|nr:single-stranded DNA-binding protein [Latilactobacillus curvatus]UTB76388.1 single-stranded DNA-binding protein [Latilactobacillus curvatus]
MINRVILIGRLTKDPELKYTSSGAAVGSFNLAVNRQFTNANGDREADFINCVIWRKSAENFANFTHKGSLVGIDGGLQTRNYENQQGQRVYVTEVVVDNFSLLEKRASDNSNANQTQSGSNKTNKPADSVANNRQAIDIVDDDLPF